MTGRISVLDLAGVVYSSGKVFDGLATGRIDTETFLRSGSLDGIASRSDLALLEDLRDVAELVARRAGEPVDAAYVRTINATITRSGALTPGQLRTDEQRIGVQTRYGRHEPPAIDDAALGTLVDDALRVPAATDGALGLFVSLASAQPFPDGNKRTALFAANAHLLARTASVLLTVPYDDSDPAVADRFNDLLARAYVLGERDAVMQHMREHGLVTVELAVDAAPERSRSRTTMSQLNSPASHSPEGPTLR